MQEKGVIRPSKSRPVVLVAKDGSSLFCIDYRRLNAITKQDVFPLPMIDDSLDLMANTKYFTTLDLAAGYWQVPMDPKSQEKTAFSTHTNLYEFVSCHSASVTRRPRSSSSWRGCWLGW